MASGLNKWLCLTVSVELGVFKVGVEGETGRRGKPACWAVLYDAISARLLEYGTRLQGGCVLPYQLASYDASKRVPGLTCSVLSSP